MTARFADVLEISLTMAVVLAVLLGLRPLLKEKLRAKAFYWVWLLAALRLCIPFNVSLPQAPVTVEAAPRQALVRVDTHRTNPGGTEYRVMTPLEAEQAQSAAYSAPREPDAPSAADRYTTVLTAGQLLALSWLTGAGVFLAWHLAVYVRFRLRVRRWGAPAEDAALLARFEEAKAELGVNNLTLLTCPAVGAPLVTGFVNPVLLLPREAVSDGVLRHELIHTRRRDLWYKLLLLLARALHWFNPLVHGMARAANRDLERACDEAAVAGQDAAFRAAYGAAMLDAVEEGIEARAPLTTHFKGGRAAMKERLLSIASGGKRKKGVALICAAALVISAGAAACSLRPAEEPGQLNGIFDQENYTLRGVGGYVAASQTDGSLVVELSDADEGQPPAWGMIVSPTPPDIGDWEGSTEDFFATLVTTYGMEMADDDGNPVLPAEAVSLTAAQVQYMGEEPWEERQWPLYTYEVLVERSDGREELHTFYMINPIHDLWFDLSQVSREEAEGVRDTLVLGHDRTESPDGTRLISIQPSGADCMLYDISGEHPVALGQVSCTGRLPGGALSDPLWSPDNQRVAATVSNGFRTSFAFPIGPFYPEMEHPDGVAGLTYETLHPEYRLASLADPFPRCVPLAWSEDSLSLQYSWAWVDTENQLHQGTAWYCFDEENHFTCIRDVVETSTTPLSERGPVGDEAFPGYDGETTWSWGGDYHIELAPDEQGVLTFWLARDGEEPVPFRQLPADYGPELRYPYSGLVEAHAFTGVLGHDGFVLTYGLGIQSIPVEYYIINEAGEPELLAEYNGQVWELDVDGDGDREVLNLHYGLDNPAVLCRWRNGRMEAADVKAAASALLGRQVDTVELLLPDGASVPAFPLALNCTWWGGEEAVPVEVPLDALDFQPV